MIKSYCKINLSLRVIKKLRNGLHDIQSNTLLLDLHDSIKINRINKKKDVVVFKGMFKKSVNNLKNSVSSTLSILRANQFLKKEKKYKIIVNKKIPVFSGLGGGTSNAAFLIKYFLKSKIDNKVIKIFEEKIGSDLRFFFNKQVYQKNLRKLIKYKKNFNFYFVLVYPNIKCSTKKIYSKVKKYSSPSKINTSKILSKNNFIYLMKKEENDLQKIATQKFNVLEKVLNFISIQKDCYFSRITGSGSVCFGMFKSRKSAILGLKIIKKKFPKYWSIVTKTI